MAITLDYALKASDVVTKMQHLQVVRGMPKRIHLACAESLGDMTPCKFRLAHLEAGKL